MTGQRDYTIAGGLLGLTAGDALGAGYESVPSVTGPVEMIGGGRFDWAPGERTDEPQMAICIAENASGDSICLDALGDQLIAWAGGSIHNSERFGRRKLTDARVPLFR